MTCPLLCRMSSTNNEGCTTNPKACERAREKRKRTTKMTDGADTTMPMRKGRKRIPIHMRDTKPISTSSSSSRRTNNDIPNIPSSTSSSHTNRKSKGVRITATKLSTHTMGMAHHTATSRNTAVQEIQDTVSGRL